MKAKVQITWEKNAPDPDLSEQKIGAGGEAFLLGLGLQGVIINLWIAGDDALADLNQQFRDKPQPTDVLSWAYETGETGSDFPDGVTEGDSTDETQEVFGEIAISLDRVRAQAAENGWDAMTELLRLLAHGCTHLAGYDHETPEDDATMRSIEERLLASIGLTSIYPA